jgi:hypothetical protein
MDAIRSLSHLKQDVYILILFFQCIFIYKGNLVTRLNYAKRVVSGDLSFRFATCPI